MDNDYILSVEGIKKSFGGVHALKGVDLKIKRGETHCLAGENGCGKSTIIKVISGFYKPDAGTIKIDGLEYTNMNSSTAINAGVQVIYQDFSIFPNLTVMENLAFNRVLANKKKLVNRAEFRKIAEEALSKINLNLDLDEIVERLPIADKQLIAISRALLDNAKLIIMDEPTTALTKREINKLFELITELKKKGITILFVSHKIDEVFEISDSITIFRSGENVISCPTSEMTEEKFSYYMTGRHFDVSEVKEKSDSIKEENALEVKNLYAEGIEDINFAVKKGEILGVTGQLGSGRTELSLVLAGMLKPTSGTIEMEGKKVNFDNIEEATNKGISLVPEDRLTEGLFLPQSIMRNITVTKLNDFKNKVGVIDEKACIQESEKWVKTLNIATSDHLLPVQTLSGGNQQKVVLAKALATKPKVFVLNGPTVGVDIGAKYDIHAYLKKLCGEGVSVIVVSDDEKEVVAICDRALVMKAGRITKVLEQSELTEKRLAEEALA